MIASSAQGKVAFLKSKDEAFEHFKALVARAENEIGQKVDKLRSNNGGEYVNAEFQAYLAKKGIHHERTNAYTSQENGVGERFNCKLMDGRRALMNDPEHDLPNGFYEDAIRQVNWIRNRIPTRAFPANTTPSEMYTGSRC